MGCGTAVLGYWQAGYAIIDERLMQGAMLAGFWCLPFTVVVSSLVGMVRIHHSYCRERSGGDRLFFGGLAVIGVMTVMFTMLLFHRTGDGPVDDLVSLATDTARNAILWWVLVFGAIALYFHRDRFGFGVSTSAD